MAIKAADQISIVDLTDAYSVILTSEAYTFPGTTNAAKAGSCSTQIVALCGAETVSASVDLSTITLPDADGIPTVAAGKYLWTRTIITYTDSSTSTSYSVGMMGATGAQGATGATGPAGADAITIFCCFICCCECNV